jgi:hypothetical protein
MLCDCGPAVLPYSLLPSQGSTPRVRLSRLNPLPASAASLHLLLRWKCTHWAERRKYHLVLFALVRCLSPMSKLSSSTDTRKKRQASEQTRTALKVSSPKTQLGPSSLLAQDPREKMDTAFTSLLIRRGSTHLPLGKWNPGWIPNLLDVNAFSLCSEWHVLQTCPQCTSSLDPKRVRGKAGDSQSPWPSPLPAVADYRIPWVLRAECRLMHGTGTGETQGTQGGTAPEQVPCSSDRTVRQPGRDSVPWIGTWLRSKKVKHFVLEKMSLCVYAHIQLSC